MGNDREEDLYAHPGPVQCGPTHHHACACREAMFAEYKKDWEDSQARLVDAVREIQRLREALQKAREIMRDFQHRMEKRRNKVRKAHWEGRHEAYILRRCTTFLKGLEGKNENFTDDDTHGDSAGDGH